MAEVSVARVVFVNNNFTTHLNSSLLRLTESVS